MTITRYYEEEAPPGELLSLRKWRRTPTPDVAAG